MKLRLWILLLGAVLAIEGMAQENAPAPTPPERPPGTFDQTRPPELNVRPLVLPKEATEEDPAVRKIQEVRAEMDRPKNETAPGAPAAPAAEERPTLYYAGRMVAALCIVLGVILLLTYILKRMGSRSPLFAGSNLAKAIGKVYLAPRVCLYFVETGGKVLVIGVMQNAIARVAEFDAAVFRTEIRETAEGETGQAREGAFNRLLAELRTEFETAPRRKPAEESEEAEVAALRKDIRRLQQYLEDTGREARE